MATKEQLRALVSIVQDLIRLEGRLNSPSVDGVSLTEAQISNITEQRDNALARLRTLVEAL
jgi:hypothetical protein